MLATVITFLIAGLWHGASWMFIVFGGLHGVGLIANHYWKKSKIKINSILAWFITFNFVNVTFIFFRAKDWGDAVKVLGGMFSLDNIVLPILLFSKLSILTNYGVKFGGFTTNLSAGNDLIIWLFIGLILTLFFKNSIEKLDNFKFNYKTTIFSGVTFCFGVLSLTKVSEFLYFNF